MDFTVEDVVPYTSRTLYTSCTSRTRGKQQFSLGGAAYAPATDEGFDEFEGLLRQTWTVFGVSILFNFQQDEVHLKQYAKRLREEVASASTQENVSYTTEFTVMKNITLRPSPEDLPPIKIEVYGKNNDKKDVKKCLYTGILLSWRTNKNELTAVNSVRLPLLLCHGAQSTIRTVHNVLNLMFDCIIIGLHAQEDDLMWLVPIIITPTNNEEYPKDKDEIQMVYKIPELPDSDTITIKFTILDLIKILKVIIKDQSDEATAEISFKLEHINKFREVLYTQMLEIANLQLGLCTLCKIGLPSFTMIGNKMKVMNADTMNRVLLYLNEKALDTFHALHFET
ncbi:uncharacterized protein LOC114878116 [Osmia bicornis bicornis]|uniref:uncharacterized protein LOC114878116 n=1 Tax=Osmia bicornis bicornis TaxID=1437191 RepID=UPI0010F94869|nr:uncharacterized protein LOC114878116 [Osmia bicornis bicornis]